MVCSIFGKYPVSTGDIDFFAVCVNHRYKSKRRQIWCENPINHYKYIYKFLLLTLTFSLKSTTNSEEDLNWQIKMMTSLFQLSISHSSIAIFQQTQSIDLIFRNLWFIPKTDPYSEFLNRAQLLPQELPYRHNELGNRSEISISLVAMGCFLPIWQTS